MERRGRPLATPDEDCFDQPVEVPPEAKRRRKQYRRYPKPMCTPEQKKALWEHQKRI
jgi:hypothetical protein